MYARLKVRPRTLLSLIVPLVMAASSLPAAAQEPVRPQQREHVVRRGDTLWGLSRLYLMNPYLWPRIFEANRDVVENPHWIYPDERLVIPSLEDTLGVSITVTTPEVPSQTQPQGRSRFYRPPAQTRESDPLIEMAQVEEPYLVQPWEWSSAPWLADTTELALRGSVRRLADPTRAEDRLPSRLHPGERVFVSDMRGARPNPGDSLMMISLDGQVAGYGWKVQPVALLEIEELMEDGGAVGRVVHQYGEAIVGQWVIEIPAQPVMRRGSTRPVDGGPTGRVVAFVDDDPLKGTADRGFIDLGETEVSPGDVLVAYVPELRNAAGQPLRAAEVATLRVVRTSDRTATVRVLSVQNTGLRDGLAVRVTQRAP